MTTISQLKHMLEDIQWDLRAIKDELDSVEVDIPLVNEKWGPVILDTLRILSRVIDHIEGHARFTDLDFRRLTDCRDNLQVLAREAEIQEPLEATHA